MRCICLDRDLMPKVLQHEPRRYTLCVNLSYSSSRRFKENIIDTILFASVAEMKLKKWLCGSCRYSLLSFVRSGRRIGQEGRFRWQRASRGRPLIRVVSISPLFPQFRSLWTDWNTQHYHAIRQWATAGHYRIMIDCATWFVATTDSVKKKIVEERGKIMVLSQKCKSFFPSHQPGT